MSFLWINDRNGGHRLPFACIQSILWSTPFVQVFGCWLMNHVIYLKPQSSLNTQFCINGLFVLGPFGQSGQYWKKSWDRSWATFWVFFPCFRGQKTLKKFFWKRHSICTEKLQNTFFIKKKIPAKTWKDHFYLGLRKFSNVLLEGLLHIAGLGIYLDWVSSWEENNYCHKRENSQNDKYFHSKQSKVVKIVVNLWTVIFFSAWDKSRNSSANMTAKN